MQSTSSSKTRARKVPWLVIHPLSQEDSVAVAALRSVVAPMKGKFEGSAGRSTFNGASWSESRSQRA